MKNIAAFLIACLLFWASACKKNSNEAVLPPGNPNNEVKASVSKNGGSVTSFISNGNSTVFSRSIYPNEDTVIVIAGSVDDRQLKITLVNVAGPGTYEFETDSGTRRDLFCDFIVGSGYAPTEFYSTQSSDTPGSITIESLTTGGIKGTFTADCDNGTVKITNGSFKGEF